MSNRSRRPKRGPSGNPLVTGDTGTYAGPQGGAEPGASVAGDLDAREYGVPQADIPGGKIHQVNPQTIPKAPAAKPERPADEHKRHGVVSDDGPYAATPDESGEDGTRVPRPAPEPEQLEAVPVYEVQHPGKGEVKRIPACDSIVIVGNTAGEPTRICNKDLHRLEVKILNEDQAHDFRIGTRSDVIEGRGALITHFSNSYVDFDSQDDLYGMGTSSSSCLASVILVTEIEER